MCADFSASGFFVHTPLGPRKSGMPESVEMPAPVSTTMRRASSTQRRTSPIGSRSTPETSMSSPATPLPFDSLIVFPWPDPVVEAVGHDPRSPYVEHFWLGILGPSTTWLLRRMAAAFDVNPDGFELDLPETAGALGLSATSGRHSPFARTLQRCVQ